jgi:hypothetical protein
MGRLFFKVVLWVMTSGYFGKFCVALFSDVSKNDVVFVPIPRKF